MISCWRCADTVILRDAGANTAPTEHVDFDATLGALAPSNAADGTASATTIATATASTSGLALLIVSETTHVGSVNDSEADPACKLLSNIPRKPNTPTPKASVDDRYLQGGSCRYSVCVCV